MDTAGPAGGRGREERGEPARHQQPGPPRPRLKVGSLELVTGSWVNALARYLDRSEQELEASRSELAHVQAQLRRLDTRVSDLDDRVTDLYGLVNRLRTDVSDERDASHHELARRFRLVCQRLTGVCGDVVARVQPVAALRPPQEARVTRAAARQFFGPMPPEADEVLEAIAAAVGGRLPSDPAERLSGLCAEVLAVRTEVARLGGAHRWDFEVDRGVSAEEGEYQVWYSCRPGDQVSFAVTPGYVVVGRPPYVPAVVFTSR